MEAILTFCCTSVSYITQLLICVCVSAVSVADVVMFHSSQLIKNEKKIKGDLVKVKDIPGFPPKQKTKGKKLSQDGVKKRAQVRSFTPNYAVLITVTS